VSYTREGSLHLNKWSTLVIVGFLVVVLRVRQPDVGLADRRQPRGDCSRFQQRLLGKQLAHGVLATCCMPCSPGRHTARRRCCVSSWCATISRLSAALRSIGA